MNTFVKHNLIRNHWSLLGTPTSTLFKNLVWSVQQCAFASGLARMRAAKKRKERLANFSKPSRNNSDFRRAKQNRRLVARELDFEMEMKDIKHTFTRSGDTTVMKFVSLMNSLHDTAKGWELFEFSLKSGAIDQVYGGNIFSRFIDVCVENNDWQKCLDAMEKLETTTKLPTSQDYVKIVKCLATEDKIEDAVRVAVMNQQHFPKNPKNGEIQHALEEMYTRLDEPAKKLALLDAMSSLGVKIDTVNYTSMISRLMKEGDLQKAMDLFTTMKEKGFRPNEITFSAIIDGYFRAGKITQALETFAAMNQLNIKQGVATFNTVANGLFRAGRSEDAWEVLQLMEHHKIKPDVITYNMMLGEIVKRGLIDKAVALFERMDMDRVKPDVISYTALITGYCKDGDLDKAMDLFNVMKDRKVSPDVVTYCTLIMAMAKKEKPEQAHELYQTMKAEKIIPTSNAFTSLITVMTKHQQLDLALKLFEEMKQAGHKPDSFVFTGLISAFGKAKRPQEAYQYVYPQERERREGEGGGRGEEMMRGKSE